MLFHYKISKLDIVVLISLCMTFFPNVISIIGGIIGVHLLSNAVTYFLCILLFVLFFLFKNNSMIMRLDNILLYIFLFYFLFTKMYSVSIIASSEKIINILYSIIIPCLILCFSFSFCGKDSKFSYNYLKYGAELSKLIIPLIFILVVMGFVDKSEGREYIVGIGNPIWASRYIGILIIFILCHGISCSKLQFYDYIILFLGFILVIKTGSRAPLIALSVVLLVLFWKHLNNIQRISLIILIIVGGIVFMLFSTRVTSGSSDYSDQARLLLLKNAFEANFNPWFGAGIGSYNLLTTGEDSLYYPHNIEIEVYIESGIIGLLLFAFLIYNNFKLYINSIIGLLFLYFFLNAQFSGDISGNNMLFIFSQLLISTSVKEPVKYIENIKLHKRTTVL